MTRLTVILLVALSAACADQTQLVKVFVVAPDPIVTVRTVETVRLVVTDPPPVETPVVVSRCTDAFRQANHAQWVNECGTSAEKEPTPLGILWPSKNGTPLR